MIKEWKTHTQFIHVCYIRLTYNLFNIYGELPGGPVVKIPCFHWRGHKFNPWLGNLRSHTLHGAAKKKKKKLSVIFDLCNIFLSFWSYPRNNGPIPKIIFWNQIHVLWKTKSKPVVFLSKIMKERTLWESNLFYRLTLFKHNCILKFIIDGLVIYIM